MLGARRLREVTWRKVQSERGQGQAQTTPTSRREREVVPGVSAQGCGVTDTSRTVITQVTVRLSAWKSVVGAVSASVEGQGKKPDGSGQRAGGR